MCEDLIKRLREAAEYTPCIIDRKDAIEAADAIEELQAQLMFSNDAAKKIAEKVPKWIPVTERLPNGNGEYLVSGNGKVWVCEFMILGNVGGWCNNAKNPCVKYWMPLPLPKQEAIE